MAKLGQEEQIGPGTEPSGTPCDMTAGAELKLSTGTLNSLFDR